MIFFFSSRRRHTRLVSDWSSDVCSSDLADLAAWVGRLLRLPPDVVEDVRVGARLHDLGKIGVPDAILNKPGPLNPDEQIGRASCRERVYIAVGRGSGEKKLELRRAVALV